MERSKIEVKEANTVHEAILYSSMDHLMRFQTFLELSNKELDNFINDALKKNIGVPRTIVEILSNNRHADKAQLATIITYFMLG